MAYTSLLDMLDGGGAGRSGSTFQGGGILSSLANAFAKPIGSQRRTSNNLSNLVVPVPSYYTNRQRKLMIQAGLIIDIKIDLINEYIQPAVEQDGGAIHFQSYEKY